MPSGIVKWFDNSKGYGFIQHNDGDVFVHYTAIEMQGFRTLNKDEIVEYEITKRPQGLLASRVRPQRPMQEPYQAGQDEELALRPAATLAKLDQGADGAG